MDRVNVDLSDYSDSTLFNLIEEVQKNEFLYDVPPSSRNNPELANKREKTWNEIAWIFGLPAVEVRSIWVKLRSGFARYFKIYQASKNTDKPFNPNNWKFFDSLLFLIPFLKLSPATVAVAKSSAQMASQTAAKRAVKRSKNFLLHQGSTSQDKGDCRIQESKNLIEAVKSKPQLWGLLSNPRSLTREENIVRDAAFEEIALELGGNVKLLKKNWYRLYYGYCKGKLSLDGELHSMMSVFDKADISTMSNGGPEPDDSPSDDSMQVNQKPYRLPFMNSNGSKPSSSQTKSLSVSPSPSRQNKHIPAIPSTTMKREATSISSETYRHNGASLFPSHLSHHDTDNDDTASSTSRRSGNLLQSSSDSLPATHTVHTPPDSMQQKFTEYHFGMCVAEMFEEVPKNKRARLKANIFAILAKEFDSM